MPLTARRSPVARLRWAHDRMKVPVIVEELSGMVYLAESDVTSQRKRREGCV